MTSLRRTSDRSVGTWISSSCSLSSFQSVIMPIVFCNFRTWDVNLFFEHEKLNHTSQTLTAVHTENYSMSMTISNKAFELHSHSPNGMFIWYLNALQIRSLCTGGRRQHAHIRIPACPVRPAVARSLSFCPSGLVLMPFSFQRGKEPCG